MCIIREVIAVSKKRGLVLFADGKTPCLTQSYGKSIITTYGDRPSVMEIEKHIIKPYTMNGGGYRYIGQEKVPTICAMYHNVFSHFPEKPYVMEMEKDTQCVAMRGRESSCLTPKRTEYGKQIRKQYEAGEIKEQRKYMQRLEPREDGKTNTLTTAQKDNMIMERAETSIERIGGGQKNDSTSDIYINENGNLVVPEATKKGFIEVKDGECFDGTYPDSKTRRGRKMSEKCNCLMTSSQELYRYESTRKVKQLNPAKEFGKQPRHQNRVYDENGISPTINMEHPTNVLTRCRIRRLTPTECARLQSIPEWYEWKGKFTDGTVKDTSDTQIYKMCGNGWNVEVIKHIFSFIDLEKIYENKKRIAG